MKKSTCPTVRTKKGVKKLNERLDNTTNGLYHTSNQFSHGRVILNSDLKGDNYGRVGSNGFCVWNGRSGSTGSVGKINKDFKRKRNSRRELQ